MFRENTFIVSLFTSCEELQKNERVMFIFNRQTKIFKPGNYLSF